MKSTNADNNHIMVSVRCATYNHAPYIRQCLDGFVMQKTNFRFEVIVHDDASTDGTTDIVREYAEKFPDIIKPMYETENQFSKNLEAMNQAINSRLIGKYIAICEGDDYWMDPMKLQKQVDFLNANLEYSYVWTNAFTIKNEKICRPYNRYKESCTPSTDDIIIGGGLWVPTASILIRSTIYKSCPKDSKFHVGDYVLQIWGAYKGKNYYFSEPMCVYRIASIGSWTNRMKKLSEKDKISIIEKEHYLLQQMNRHTNGVFSDIFNQRWHLYAFREFKAINDFEKAKSHWYQLYPKYRKGFENRCFVNRYFFIAKFIGKFRRLRVKIVDYKFRI